MMPFILSAACVFVVAAIAGVFAVPAAAQEASSHSLFNPVPVDKMRAMVPDRPSQTEGPFTVDAGHYQVEMDLWNRTIDRSHDSGLDVRAIDTAYAPVNFRMGLTDSTDLHVIFGSYHETLTRNAATGAVLDKNHGVGDVTARLKFNLWGNDGSSSALAILPFVKLPTNSNGLGNKYVEGGVILPYDVKVLGDIDLGLMTEVDAQRNGANTGYTAVFVNSAVAGFSVTDRLGTYAEVFTSLSGERGAHLAVSLDAGLTFALTPNLQLDAGVNVGVTSAAPDLNPFVGLSVRF